MLGMREQNRDWHGRWIRGPLRKLARSTRGKDDRPQLPPPQLLTKPIPDNAMAGAADNRRDETDDARLDGSGAGEGTKSRPDYELLVDRMDEVKNALYQVPRLISDQTGLDEQLTLMRELLIELDRLREFVDLLEAGGSEQGPSAAVVAAAQAEAIRADAKAAHKRWKAGWTRVWEAVKRMLPQLWVLISGLLHVKEWTVSGQLKSDPFSLASASVTVTFARPD